MSARTRLLLHGPILGTLLRLAAPNLGEAAARVAFIACDAVFVSWLGTDALAGVSLVFPIFLLMQMMSASGLGAGVSAAVGRAFGAGNRQDAVAGHGVILAIGAAAVFALIMLFAGRDIYRALGLVDAGLDAALIYSNLVFGGIAFVWLMNILANVLRGAGNMVVPAGAIIAGEAVHLVLSPALILGWGPLPSLGVAGAAIGVLASYLFGSLILLIYLLSGRGDIRLSAASFVPRRRHFSSILGVGIFASLNVAQVQLTAVVITGFVAVFGTSTLAGYGAASRLELLQFPLSFALGSAVIAMLATNVGAADWERARQIARTGTALSVLIGAGFGAVALIIPGAWMRLFSEDHAVIEPGVLYLRSLSITYPLLGLGLGLFFALLGAGRPIWPFLMGAVRLLLVGVMGWFIVYQVHGSFLHLTLVVGAGTAVLALGMLITGRDLLRAERQPALVIPLPRGLGWP